MAILLLILALLSERTVGRENGVARTPPMGWNPYNVYSCDTTENQYRAAAQALLQTGLRDLGYKYFNMDCGWQATSRAPPGVITWDPRKMPSGISAFAEYVHSLGLLFGLYSDAGYFSCDGANGALHRIGSLGHEATDAGTFIEWGVDYLKYDNCFAVSPNEYENYNPPIQEEDNYARMGDALSAAGSDIVYAICEWGIQDPARWAGPIGNSWQISNNIGATFADLKRIINQLVPITAFGRPGAWSDLDLLEVGNSGLTQAEWAMQFAFWAAAKQVRPSPLLISTDLTSASEDVLNILSNERIISVNQDPLGMSIVFNRRYTDDNDVWSGPLADGSTVVVILNWMDTPQMVTFNLSDVDLASADATDLWTGIDLGTVYGWTTSTVDAHGALIYKLTNGVPAPPRSFTTYLASASQNVLGGGATSRTLSDGSTTVVGDIGYTGTLMFVGVDGGTSGGTKLLMLAYINADYTFVNTECSNCRRAEVTVNGSPPVQVEMPISGQSWDRMFEGYILSLDGFVPGPDNGILFSNPNGWAPDMYSIDVEE